MTNLIEYMTLISPGLTLVVLTFVLTPRKLTILRVMLLIFGFILMRDAMTPLGFWQFGTTVDPVQILWLRFTEDSLILATFALTSLLVTVLVLATNPDLSKLVKWGNPKSLKTYGIGILGAVVVTAPILLAYTLVPIEMRGGHFAVYVLPALLAMAILGNFLEEVLFRGFLQGYLENFYGATRALVLAALLFAVGHIFLASTVTSIGLPISLFVLYEGFVCGYIRNQAGVVASTVSHGLAIFILASALI